MVSGPISGAFATPGDLCRSPEVTLEGYKQGDEVTFLGSKGIILNVYPKENFLERYPIEVQFHESHRIRYFMADGRLEPDLVGAKLEVVRRSKQKTKKYLWVVKSKSTAKVYLTDVHSSEEEVRLPFKGYEPIMKVQETEIEVDE